MNSAEKGSRVDTHAETDALGSGWLSSARGVESFKAAASAPRSALPSPGIPFLGYLLPAPLDQGILIVSSPLLDLP